ncbi:MAG: hypothetical protein N2C14_22300 [Planctomycetales bacterium]
MKKQPLESSENAPAPRGRASWTGLLQIGLVTLPVKAYSAIDSTEPIRFNQLHAGCGQRITQPRHCPVHGALDAAEIERAHQYAPGQYVVIEASELEAMRPAKDKALCIEQFVDPEAVDPVFFSGRSSYLLPSDRVAWQAYLLLVHAMRTHRRWGLGRVVLSGRRRAAALRAEGGLLTMHVLHDPPQVRPAERWREEIPQLELDASQRQLAERLVEASTEPVDWSRYRDDLEQQLSRLVELKIAGRQVVAQPDEPLAETVSLLDALQQSVAQAEADVAAEVRRSEADPDRSEQSRRTA